MRDEQIEQAAEAYAAKYRDPNKRDEWGEFTMSKLGFTADPGNPKFAMAFKAEELIKFCSWMRHRHVDTPIKFNSNGYTCKAACGKDVALIMPARPADDELIDVRLIED